MKRIELTDAEKAALTTAGRFFADDTVPMPTFANNTAELTDAAATDYAAIFRNLATKAHGQDTGVINSLAQKLSA